MSQGLEYVPTDEQSYDYESAPCSADFSITRRVFTSATELYKKPPIKRGRHQKKVPTLENGLVDMDGLLMYLHPNPLYVPLYSTRGWKYHHVNHPKSSFKQVSLPVEERSTSLTLLRNSPYQQLHMRVSSEQIYHDVHEIQVPHPVANTVEKAIIDLERLDMLGAACLFLKLSKGNSQYGIDAGSFDPQWFADVPLKDRVEFISEVREDCARALVRAQIIPDRLVTSAIKRLSIHLKDQHLSDMADRRLASDPIFYPVKVPAHKTLLIKANRLLALEFAIQRSDSLQTEVNEVKLAA